MSSRLTVGVVGLGLLGPGLNDWHSAHAVLLNPGTWSNTPTAVAPPLRLPPNERRRASTVVKAAVLVADQACAMAGLDPALLATVFTSATGDGANCHALCEALATPARLLSPTRFTNSVHNTAAGYWHIAVGSQQTSTSLAAFDASVAAGLLEAAAQCVTTQRPVLLVVADQPYPAPLHALRPVADVFAFAMILVPEAPPVANSISRLTFDLIQNETSTACEHPALEALRRSVPAALGLPLLVALAQGSEGLQASAITLLMEGLGGSVLRVRCSPAASGCKP